MWLHWDGDKIVGCCPDLPSSECSQIFPGSAIGMAVEDGIGELAGQNLQPRVFQLIEQHPATYLGKVHIKSMLHIQGFKSYIVLYANNYTWLLLPGHQASRCAPCHYSENLAEWQIIVLAIKEHTAAHA